MEEEYYEEVAEETPLEEYTDTITVRVGRLPGPMGEIDLNGGRLVSDAIAAAGISKYDAQVRVNGQLVGMDYELSGGESVHVIRQITGN